MPLGGPGSSFVGIARSFMTVAPLALRTQSMKVFSSPAGAPFVTRYW